MKLLLPYILMFIPLVASAQMQARFEPRHKNVFENQYIRLLDVHIAPGDTSEFHIHSTPSFFLRHTNTNVWSQNWGQEWTQSLRAAGVPSFDLFPDEPLVHRVTNSDTSHFHVTDIEILARYQSRSDLEPLPFELLVESETIVAYRLDQSSMGNIPIRHRGPMVAQLVEGAHVYVYDEKTKQSTILKTSGFLYFDPESAFSFTAPENENIELVLLEIK